MTWSNPELILMYQGGGNVYRIIVKPIQVGHQHA